MTSFKFTNANINIGIKEFILINAGLLIDSLGIYFFRVPNHFANGGVAGIAIILNKVLENVSVGFLMLILNILLLLVGLVFVGFGFGARTIYGSFALSIFVWAWGKIYPVTHPLTGDTMLELIFAVLLSAIGAGIVFYQNASTGGTDIIAKILNRKTNLHIGKTLLITDFIITIFAFLIFGIRIGMYSILGVIMKGFLIDMVIGGFSVSKQLFIISERAEEIKNYIIYDLHRGATIYKAVGAATNSERLVINTVVSRGESIKLRNFVRHVDNKAFITINSVSEIVGKGFRSNDL